MHKIASHLVHNGHRFLAGISTVIFDEHGIILDVLEGTFLQDAKLYNGVICPGFVNAHCHLELSHLLGKIPKNSGLVNFLEHVNNSRNHFTEEQILTSIANAEKQMLVNGIVAVGDISNGLHSYQQKQFCNLYYHTFVECVGVLPNHAQDRFAFSKQVLDRFLQINSSTLVPHAAYSVSEQLFSKINTLDNNIPISIHNQECICEDDLIRNASGNFVAFLEKITQNQLIFEAHNKSSLEYFAPLLAQQSNILLVHNTYTNINDVRVAQQYFENRHWVFCANANLYIENKLPKIYNFLYANQENICLGTDSLASNDELNIYSEMLTIYNNFEDFSPEILLQWATKNGAKALNLKTFGIIEKNYKPGLLFLENWTEKNGMHSEVKIERIV